MSEENNALHNEQPQEVVLWYTPQTQQPKEVVCYYEQPTPLPGNCWQEIAPKDIGVWHEAAQKEKRRRYWPWIIVLLVVLAIGAGIAIGLHRSHVAPVDTPSDEDSASSIVDIFNDKGTSIPRYKGGNSLRMTCQSDHGDTLTPQQVYAKVNPSVVTVIASVDNYGSVGTGVIISEDGYILTNAHVISGGKECMVALANGFSYEAQLVGYDEGEDLAVLKAINAENLIPAEFGDSELANVGDPVYAIGNPLGLKLRGTLTDGIISAINRDVNVDGKSMTLIQTNAALNNGNSGGPLINAYGQVIGINTLKMSGKGISTEATVEGLGFALPISRVYFVVNDIISTGSFHGYPTIGITVISTVSADNIPCVVILEVTKDSDAEKAGLQSGDILLAADGKSVSDTVDLYRVRREHVIGDEIVLTVLRNGETMDIPVLLQSDR